MSLCPECGRGMCDHTPEERGQSYEEMMRQMTPEEKEVWRDEPTYSKRKVAIARRNAHLDPNKTK